MPGKFKYVINGDKQVIQGIQRMSSSAKNDMLKSLQKGADRVEETMKGAAPRVTGEFSGSIDYDIDMSTLTAEVGPNDAKSFGGRPVGLTIERGRRRGATPPPPKALMDRYGLNLAQAIAAAKTIGERGVPGKPFAKKTWGRIQPFISQLGIEAVAQITTKF